MYHHLLILVVFCFTAKSENLVPDKELRNVVQVSESGRTVDFPSTYTWVGPLIRSENQEFQKDLVVVIYESKDNCHIKNCKDLHDKIAVFDTNPFTTLKCTSYTIIHYLQRCQVSGALLYKKDLEKRTSGWGNTVKIVSAWVEQSFMDYVVPRLENGTNVQVRFLAASSKVLSSRDNYVRVLQGYVIFTPIAFGILFIWTNYHLVTKVVDSFKISNSQNSSHTGGKKQANTILTTLAILWQEKSLLLFCYLCLWLVTLQRTLYDGIDWRGYRGRFSAAPREIIDTIANGLIVSMYTLIITSWAEIAKPEWTRSKVTWKMVCLIFNVILYIYLITATIIGSLSGNDSSANYFLAACSLLVIVLFIVFGSRILITFKKVSKLSSSQKQLRKITWFTLGSCITALLLLIALILGQLIEESVGDFTFHYLYRILEIFLFGNILAILRIPRKHSSPMSSSPSGTETEKVKDTEELTSASFSNVNNSV